MFKTILVATDGSEHAAKAVTIASDLAAKYGARLIFLHVTELEGAEEDLRHLAEAEHLGEDRSPRHVKDIEATPGGPVPVRTLQDSDAAAALLAAKQAVAKRVLSDAEGVAKERQVSDVETVTDDSGEDAAKSILALAERRDADAIAMGSRGMSNVKGVIFGSVSNKVCREARATCITVT